MTLTPTGVAGFIQTEMSMLKLMRLPHGTNRNRTLRRTVEFKEEEIDLAEVERLFRRFWHQWRARTLADARSQEGP